MKIGGVLMSTVDHPQWLSLTQAARLLGVHPTTLRRWCDRGEVPVHVTPGGHRRFLRAELDGFTRQQPALVPDRTGQVWGDYALVETRERLELGPEPHWLAAFSPQEREEERELGRRLMALMMQHLSAPDDDQALLIEAKSIAVRYAQTCMQVGLTASEGLEATTFFRDALTEVALQMPQVASLDSGARLRLLRKINQVFNVVQLGVVEYFDHHH